MEKKIARESDETHGHVLEISSHFHALPLGIATAGTAKGKANTRPKLSETKGNAE
jgi:hypothetical protein